MVAHSIFLLLIFLVMQKHQEYLQILQKSTPITSEQHVDASHMNAAMNILLDTTQRAAQATLTSHIKTLEAITVSQQSLSDILNQFAYDWYYLTFL